ncbi:putative transferase CAF17 homolog, mitochondrial [Bacillus rossius redtenbacheri]|uniref:putative transferase CAF17 homolog, mitochondrial n=1 Tax=Bacillus rossius redtenbacheri TaxID=93214 RepID=UPI002FDCC4A1
MSVATWLRLCGSCKLRSISTHGARKLITSAGSIETTAVECLRNRGILRVSGPEVSGFLQGLITNDMRHFDEGALSMYAMFLNIKGRVLCDTIIYKGEDNVYFLECDANFMHSLQKHLKLFRVRKKIDIVSMENEFKVWVIYNTHFELNNQKSVSEVTLTETVKKHFSQSNVIASKDPRLPDLGMRIVTPAEVNLEDINSQENKIMENSCFNYRTLRYRLGVPEGIDELPPEKCFPLEINCDYLHGVSFHKGCYIGQEVTARTHHTGIVRKRIMPLIFDLIPKDGFVSDMPILDMSSQKVIGKLRAAEKDSGLGLLRIEEALECQTFKISDGTGHTYKPIWWPKSLPKDRISVTK